MKDAPAPEAPEQRKTRSRLRFRTLFEQAPFSIQLLAPDGRTLEVNEAWERLWQVTPGDGVKEYVLTQYNMLDDPQLEAKGIREYVHRAFAGESVSTPPIYYDPAEIGKPGRARWVAGHFRPISDDSGRIAEVMLIHEDVTERVETEDALRGSEMRLKQLANTIPQLAWMADPNGSIHWYNDRWYEYTGTTPQEMQGWGWQSVHDPDVLPDVITQWRRSLETGAPFQMTFPLRGRDGKFRPFYTLVAPLKDDDGNVEQWFGTNTDVSELHEAEARLRLATEAGDIGIWDWDIANDHVTWSDRVYRLHGIDEWQFGHRLADFERLLHPEDVALLGRKVQEVIAGAEGFSAEFRVVLPDGSVRWLSTWARVSRASDGRAERLIGATISVDAYKKAETALKESDRRKDEFLAMLAHELRNPLAPISTAAHLLTLPDLGPDGVARASAMITRQVQHMTEIVDDLLDVSRVTRGLIKLDTEPLDVKTVIAAAIEQVRPLIDARQHTLTTRVDAARLTVLGDRTRLVQVLVNLLNNAAKYTPAHGNLLLVAAVRGDQAVISVTDNGAGIDPALLPHVFELFTQAARTPDRSQGGLGIGLALVKSLVSLHGGSVIAESKGIGHGCTFTLMLPLLQQESRSENAAPAPAEAARRPRRIMIVDDNVDAAQSLAQWLELQGHAVTVTENAQGALREAPRHPPEVFILDIGLPQIDGYELARRLRAEPGCARALFIALTGYGQSQDRAMSRDAGFDHHFVKPIDIAQLDALLA